MLSQSFAVSDIPSIFTLAFLELLLSADNAVVLGVLSHSLAPHLRKKALFIGIGSAFFLRFGALLGFSLFLEARWLQLLGGAYLVYLMVRYLTKSKRSIQIPPRVSFWKTVVLIEILDLVFAIDSILAGLAFINTNYSKLWVVYLGGMLGIMGMRWAADFFGTLLLRFPYLEQSAYLVVGWIGVKLGLLAFHLDLPVPLFWFITLLLFLLGFYRKKQLN